MARVKGPNGLVLTVPDAVADGLLKSSDFELVKDESKPKSADKRPSPKK